MGVDDAVAAVSRIPSIDRAAVRRDCEERFSDVAIVDAYLELYRDLLAAIRR